MHNIAVKHGYLVLLLRHDSVPCVAANHVTVVCRQLACFGCIENIAGLPNVAFE